jgi:hypothetical protein
MLEMRFGGGTTNHDGAEDGTSSFFLNATKAFVLFQHIHSTFVTPLQPHYAMPLE